MKTVLFVYMLTVAALCGCSNQSRPAATISICVDITDRKQIWPKATYLLQQLHCDENPMAAYRVRVRLISDKVVAPSWEETLPPKSESAFDALENDPQTRNRQIQQYYSRVRRMFDEIYHRCDTTGSLAYSECWAAIATELQVLAEDSAERRYLYIYSDGFEKSAVNMYHSLSENTIDSVAAALLQIRPVPKQLRGVIVIFVYQPLTRSDDLRFALTFKVYQKMLEPLGAIVQLQTTE